MKLITMDLCKLGLVAFIAVLVVVLILLYVYARHTPRKQGFTKFLLQWELPDKLKWAEFLSYAGAVIATVCLILSLLVIPFSDLDEDKTQIVNVNSIMYVKDNIILTDKLSTPRFNTNDLLEVYKNSTATLESNLYDTINFNMEPIIVPVSDFFKSGFNPFKLFGKVYYKAVNVTYSKNTEVYDFKGIVEYDADKQVYLVGELNLPRIDNSLIPFTKGDEVELKITYNKNDITEYKVEQV